MVATRKAGELTGFAGTQGVGSRIPEGSSSPVLADKAWHVAHASRLPAATCSRPRFDKRPANSATIIGYMLHAVVPSEGLG